jgi:hypothetical protein
MPYDFHNPQVSARRYQDCDSLADHMRTIGLDTSWWEGVKAGKSYAWQKLVELDVNHHMSQFIMELDEKGQVVGYSKDSKSEELRRTLAK